jgi:hypothetical protein
LPGDDVHHQAGRPLRVDPDIDGAVDAAVRASGWQAAALELPGWYEARAAQSVIIDAEAARANACLPASIQLTGPAGSEDLLLATGAVIEAAAGYRHKGVRWPAARWTWHMTLDQAVVMVAGPEGHPISI